MRQSSAGLPYIRHSRHNKGGNAVLGFFIRGASASSRYNRRIQDTLQARGISYRLLTPQDIVVDYDSEPMLRDRRGEPFHLNCVWQRLDTGRFLPLLDIMEAAGVRVINSARAWRVAMNKAVQSAVFSACGIPQPRTHFTYAPPDHLDGRMAASATPWIAKRVNRDMGRCIHRVRDVADLRRVRENNPAMRHHNYLQCYVETPGKRQWHLRVSVVAGRAVQVGCCTAPAGQFISNYAQGGEWEVIESNRELDELAVRATDACGMDYAGVDIMEGQDGYSVIEINDNAGLGEPAVAAVIDHIIDLYPRLRSG